MGRRAIGNDPSISTSRSILVLTNMSQPHDDKLLHGVVPFDPVISPLRIPLPTLSEEDPSKGPFVLAFKDEATWLHSWRDCEIKVAEQCEAGARVGCSIKATRECKSPWWHTKFPFLKRSKSTPKDQETCEEERMSNCFTDAKDKCLMYAKDICRESFCEARVAGSDDNGHRYRYVKGDRHLASPPVHH